LLDFESRLELQAGVRGELGHADAEPGVPPPVAVHLDEDVGGALEDVERVLEPGGDRDVAYDLDDALHAIEILDRLLGGCEHAERRETGGVPALLDGDLAADLAGILQLPVLLRQLAGDEQEIPAPNALHVGPERLADLGQTES